jgi:hypothetical protein
MIDNSKLILELFNYKKGLTLEQEDIERQVSHHITLLNADEIGKQHSQKNIIRSISERLTPYTYDNSVKKLLENLGSLLKNDELFYELEDLYRVLENSNQGMVYRHVMKIILDIINESNIRNQQIKILNELAIHDWIPAVKNFVFKYTTDPKDRQNITSKGGKADNVYSMVEKINTENDKGFLTYIGDKWFFITENSVDASKVPSDFIKDTQKLHSLNLLQKALQIGTIEDKKIVFSVDEDLTVAISCNNGDVFINNEKVDKSATLESIFDSALIPFMRKDLYPIVSETVKNLDKFVELDIVQKITNITNPFLECFAFNYKDKMYLYSKDNRYGSNFYEYDSATMLCNEMNNQLGYDLSQFLKNKFTKDLQVKKDLESKEQFIADKLSEVNENIQKLKNCGLLEINEEVKTAHSILVLEKTELEKELFNVKAKLANK